MHACSLSLFWLSIYDFLSTCRCKCISNDRCTRNPTWKDFERVQLSCRIWKVEKVEKVHTRYGRNTRDLVLSTFLQGIGILSFYILYASVSNKTDFKKFKFMYTYWFRIEISSWIVPLKCWYLSDGRSALFQSWKYLHICALLVFRHILLSIICFSLFLKFCQLLLSNQNVIRRVNRQHDSLLRNLHTMNLNSLWESIPNVQTP